MLSRADVRTVHDSADRFFENYKTIRQSPESHESRMGQPITEYQQTKTLPLLNLPNHYQDKVELRVPQPVQIIIFKEVRAALIMFTHTGVLSFILPKPKASQSR